ncbi:MAG: hypothetical protein ABSA13_06990 [Beijerinckiaceae bacterium]|jgi:hypothetical protein
MKFDLISTAVALVTWTLAYFLFIRHWLMQYKTTASIITRIQAAENNLLAKIGIWFEAKKALAVGFLASLFGAAHTGAISTVSAAKATATTVASTVNALQPADVDAFKDQSLWHGLLNDSGIELKIMSVLAFITALLAVKGHVAAAKIVPAIPAPAAPVAPGAATPAAAPAVTAPAAPPAQS